MTQRDHDGRPGGLPSEASVPAEAPRDAAEPKAPAESEGLASHFVRRTDNDFHGIEDRSLIGEDIGDDLVDENGDPIED